MMMIVSIAYLLLGLVGREFGAYQPCAGLLVRLSDDAASLHGPIDAVLILSRSHGLIVHASTCHHVLLAVVCCKLVLVRHELIVLHSISPVDLGDRSASLAPIAALAVTALPVI